MTVPQRVIAGVVLLVALGAFVVAGMTGETGGSSGTLVSGSDDAVEELIPAPDSEVLRQSQVGVDLASGYAAELYVNGTLIPSEELNRFRNPEDPRSSNETAAENAEVGLNRFVFQPQTDHVIETLDGDENCARAIYWPLADPGDRRTVEWCFTAA